MKAIGYFRESARGETLAQQNKAFFEYCEREGLESAGTFADASSANGHGQGFRQLLALLRKGDGGYLVVVHSLAALGGDLSDAARRYFQIEGLGVHVTPMVGAADLEGDLVTKWGAREPGSNAGDRVRAAMRRKAVKGEVLGRPPYGYKVGSRRRLELIPEEAVVVRYIFRIYLQEGLGIRLIARRLNEEGLRTRRGGNWSMVSIRDILRNRAYLGTYARFGVRVPGSHPPLVSVEDFRAVQDRLNAKRTSYNPRVPSQFLLSGIAYCGYCGNKLIGVSRKQSWKRASGERIENSYRYYQCESRTNQSVCDYHTRRAPDLERAVREAIPAALASAAGETPPTEGEAIAAADRERERLRTRLKIVDRRIERYVDAAAKGTLTKDKMHRQSLAAASERLALEDALEAAERQAAGGSEPDRVALRAVAAAHLCAEWDALPFSDWQHALRELIARVTVTDDAVLVEPRP
jgi:DNA invertase Pin-like site-specific DNA recombinase